MTHFVTLPLSLWFRPSRRVGSAVQEPWYWACYRCHGCKRFEEALLSVRFQGICGGILFHHKGGLRVEGIRHSNARVSPVLVVMKERPGQYIEGGIRVGKMRGAKKRKQPSKPTVVSMPIGSSYPLTPYARYIGGFRFYPPLTETPEPPPKHGRETPNKTPVRNKICSGATRRCKAPKNTRT